MGRKRVPQELKIVRGTYQPCRDPRGGEKISNALQNVPRVPSGLRDEGKKLWQRLTAYLVEVGILLEHHIPLLQIVCMEYQVYWDANSRLASGKRIKLEERRELRLLKNGAYQNFRMLLLEFGLTPSAAEKIPKPGKKKEMDAIEKIMKGTSRAG